MNTVMWHLADQFLRRCKEEGWYGALVGCVGGLAACVFRRAHKELFALDLFRNFVALPGATDVLAHLSHRHYLSRALSYRQRIATALCHYRYEDAQYDGRYRTAVYRDGGLSLWSASVGEVRYELRLVASPELRHEGDISVVFAANGVRLCAMSFSWVDASVFGAHGGPIPFVTRNQSAHSDTPALAGFRRDFPQNSPPYFCLAAIHGLAAAHGRTRIAAIKHDSQIAFAEPYEKSFRHSYSDFWRSFGASELDHQALSVPVPLALPDLSTVKAKHRKRAQERRRHWAAVSRSAFDTVSRHLSVDRRAPRVVFGPAVPA